MCKRPAEQRLTLRAQGEAHTGQSITSSIMKSLSEASFNLMGWGEVKDVRHNFLHCTLKLHLCQVMREKNSKAAEVQKFRDERDRIAAALEMQIKKEKSCNQILKVNTGSAGIPVTAGDRLWPMLWFCKKRKYRV